MQSLLPDGSLHFTHVFPRCHLAACSESGTAPFLEGGPQVQQRTQAQPKEKPSGNERPGSRSRSSLEDRGAAQLPGMRAAEYPPAHRAARAGRRGHAAVEQIRWTLRSVGPLRLRSGHCLVARMSSPGRTGG